jgi:hypothetical protein
MSWQVKITASTRPGGALARWPGAAPADAAELAAERRGDSVEVEEDMESSLRRRRGGRVEGPSDYYTEVSSG